MKKFSCEILIHLNLKVGSFTVIRLKNLTVVSNVSAIAWLICSIKLSQRWLGICLGGSKKKIDFSCVAFFAVLVSRRSFFYLLFNRKSHDQCYTLEYRYI